MTPSDGGALGRGTNPPWVSGQTLDPAVPGVPADLRLTRAEALRGSTTDCAWNLDQEGRLGSIKPGKHADLIVLSDDYFTVPTQEIRNLRSLLTVVGGRIVHANGPYSGLAD
jgi:predicted amidohydrolase YtcJ